MKKVNKKMTAKTTKVAKTNARNVIYANLTVENKEFLSKLAYKTGLRFEGRYINSHLTWLRKQGLDKAVKQIVSQA